MSIKIKGIYVLVNGSWKKAEKVFKDGAWRETKGIFYNGNWYEIDVDPDPDPHITVTPTNCNFDYNGNPDAFSTGLFTLTSTGAWTISASWSSGYSNWCWIRTLDDLPISSGGAGTYNLKVSCSLWGNPTLNEVRNCTFTFGTSGITTTYEVTQGRLKLEL